MTITVKMSRSDHIFTIILFGSIFAYFLYGAITGDLYLPGKNGPGCHLSGLGAWMVTGSPVLCYLGLIVRSGFFEFTSERVQGITELLFLFSGIALLFIGLRFC
jgi:hypothetical protein